MKIKKQVIIIFLLMLVCLIKVEAIGISPASITLNFEPNLRTTYTFYASNNKYEAIYIVPSVYGDLEKYIKLVNNSPKLVNPGESAEFKVVINLPSAINTPGLRKSYLSVSESFLDKQGGGNAIFAITSVSASIDIKVPYPGKYATVDLITPNVDVGEPAKFKMYVENFGKQHIAKAKGELTIQDVDKVIKKVYTESVSIEPKTTEILTLYLDTSNIPSGDYQAIAVVDYDGFKAADQENFRLGDLYVNLTDYTKEFELNEINRWDIFVESRWNKQITNLYAEAKIVQDEQEIDINTKTPSINLEPWETTRLNAFWDTSGFAAGEYDAKLIFHYNDKIQEYPIKIKILKPKISTQLPLLVDKIGLKLFLLLIIVIILVIDLVWLIVVSRKIRKNEKK